MTTNPDSEPLRLEAREALQRFMPLLNKPEGDRLGTAIYNCLIDAKLPPGEVRAALSVAIATLHRLATAL